MNVSRRYNLVEVILALGVVAIGVVSIMALFPIGANASRDASMETYAANVSDEMLQFVKYRLKLVEDNDNEQDKINKRWKDLVGTDTDPGAITETKPTKAKLDVDITKLDDTSEWETPDTDIFGDIFESTHTIYQHHTDKQVFQLLGHRNSDDVKLGDTDSDPKKDFATNVDFRAIAYIWKEQIAVDKTQSSDDDKYVPYTSGVRIIVRVTWPAEIPYDARQKADYVLEVFKPIVQE
jgi:uncharacterized protein (TIGR02598 family)